MIPRRALHGGSPLDSSVTAPTHSTTRGKSERAVLSALTRFIDTGRTGVKLRFVDLSPPGIYLQTARTPQALAAALDAMNRYLLARADDLIVLVAPEQSGTENAVAGFEADAARELLGAWTKRGPRPSIRAFDPMSDTGVHVI